MNDYSSLFESLGAWNWLIFGGLLMVLELVVPGSFLLFIGFAAAAVGVVALSTDIAWQYQCLLFAALCIAFVALARVYWRSGDRLSEQPMLGRRTEQFIGRSYVVAEAIKNGRGKIRIGDTLWSVEGPDTPQGEEVVVTGAQSATLRVEAKS